MNTLKTALALLALAGLTLLARAQVVPDTKPLAILAGTGIRLTTNSVARGAPTLTISATGTNSTSLTIPLVAGAGISITTNNAGAANETLTISATGTNSTSLTIPLVAGAGISITTNNAGATNESLTITFSGTLDTLSISNNLSVGSIEGSGAGITNLQAGAFAFSSAQPDNQGTNFVVNLSGATYQTITATNNVCFQFATNGPGACTVIVWPNGANRTITAPTNWCWFGTNSSVTLTNGHRLLLSLMAAKPIFTGTDQTNVNAVLNVSP